MFLFWDGKKKPIWDTMKDQTKNIDGERVHIASYRTEPYRDSKEAALYMKMLQRFEEKEFRDPLSKNDFMKIKDWIDKDYGRNEAKL